MKKPLRLKVVDLLLELDREKSGAVSPKARSPSARTTQEMPSVSRSKSIRFGDLHVHGNLVVKVTQTSNSAQLLKEIDRVTASLPESKRARARKNLLKCLSSVAFICHSFIGVSP